MPAELPGYFFEGDIDAEKQKYFKIQPHHKVPVGSQYSRENLQRTAKTKEREEIKRKRFGDAWGHLVRTKRPVVRQARILAHAHGSQLGLERELGLVLKSPGQRRGHRSHDYEGSHRPSRHEMLDNVRPKALARGLEKNGELTFGSSEMRASTTEIASFVMHEETGMMFLEKSHLQERRVSTFWSLVPHHGMHKGRKKFRYSSFPLRGNQVGEIKISSLQIGSKRTVVSTAGAGSPNPAFTVVKLVQPNGQLPRDYFADCVHMSCRLSEETTIWSSAISPGEETIALGTSTGVTCFAETPWGYQPQLPPDPDTAHLASNPAHDSNVHRGGGGPTQVYSAKVGPRDDADVLAVEFISDGLLAAGQRNGRVDILDKRKPRMGTDRQGTSSHFVRHPSSVTNIKKVDDHHIIVCGLENSLCMYDLRFSHPPSPRKAFMEPTRPVLEYDHQNEYRLGLGFDIDIDAGLVAAATDQKTTNLFVLNTSEKISLSPFTGISSQRPRFTHDSLARCIRFSNTGPPSSSLFPPDNELDEVEEYDPFDNSAELTPREEQWLRHRPTDCGRGPKSLLIAAGDKIEEWAW
ncbi:MAG: hypothetical protein M4579_002390 [Chaenotheca gracillima]|nr:MAG: hypothetical protein M4579_002390 [Chaenotheca gracillima]